MHSQARRSCLSNSADVPRLSDLWLGWFPDLFYASVISKMVFNNLSMQFCVCWRICSFAGDGTIYYLDRLFRAQLGSRVHFLTCLAPDSHDVQVFQIQTALVFFWGMLKSYHFDLAYAVAKYDKAWTIGWVDHSGCGDLQRRHTSIRETVPEKGEDKAFSRYVKNFWRISEEFVICQLAVGCRHQRPTALRALAG